MRMRLYESASSLSAKSHLSVRLVAGPLPQDTIMLHHLHRVYRRIVLPLACMHTLMTRGKTSLWTTYVRRDRICTWQLMRPRFMLFGVATIDELFQNDDECVRRIIIISGSSTRCGARCQMHRGVHHRLPHGVLFRALMWLRTIWVRMAMTMITPI